jgi:hypothetical protein
MIEGSPFRLKGWKSYFRTFGTTVSVTRRCRLQAIPRVGRCLVHLICACHVTLRCARFAAAAVGRAVVMSNFVHNDQRQHRNWFATGSLGEVNVVPKYRDRHSSVTEEARRHPDIERARWRRSMVNHPAVKPGATVAGINHCICDLQCCVEMGASFASRQVALRGIPGSWAMCPLRER